MAAEAFLVPDEVGPAPDLGDYVEGGFDDEAYSAAIDSHRGMVASWCRTHTDSKSDLVGETIRFPVADGYAEYMVYRTRPLQLIHLPYVDAWEVNPIMLRGLRVSDVKEMVERSRKINALFGGGEHAAQ